MPEVILVLMVVGLAGAAFCIIQIGIWELQDHLNGRG